MPPLRNGRGLGRCSRTAGRRGGREVDGYMQREEGTPIQENPEADRYLGTGYGQQVEATRRGKAVTARARKSFGPPHGGEAQTSGGGRQTGVLSR